MWLVMKRSDRDFRYHCIQDVLGAPKPFWPMMLALKRPESEAHLSSAEIENAWIFTAIFSYEVVMWFFSTGATLQ
jgi:hypothetical protein